MDELGPKVKRRNLVDGTAAQNGAPSTTTLYDLPLEILDIILCKSYLDWVLNSSTKKRSEEVIRSLILVDVCFSRRITRGWFMKAIFNYLKGHMAKRRKLMDGTTEQNGAPSTTNLYDLPLEILDVILHKSYLHWILYSTTKQRDEEIVRSLISVDVCFYRRITRRRLKKAIWRYLKAFHGETRKGYDIIRNNRTYLIENIKLSNELISSLLTLKCITPKDSHLIQIQHSDRGKIDKLLTIMRSFNEEKFSNCVKCLRRINQKTVARIIENGGGIIKIKVHSPGEKCTESMGTLQQLHQKIEDLQNKAIPWSHRINRSISHLSDEGIEILNSHLDRQTLVIWIWCHSQAAVEYTKRLYESNQMSDIFFEVIQPFTSKIVEINRNQFDKTFVKCPLSIKFTENIVGGDEDIFGMTKLRNEIYVLCQSHSSGNVICVFQDQPPFLLRKKIEVNQTKYAVDISSIAKENSLYISDYVEKCIWKIATETESDGEPKIIKWLTTDYEPDTLSVTNDGQLLVVDMYGSILRIYESDRELLLAIKLLSDIKYPRHAVETSMGNFVIIHQWAEKEEKVVPETSGMQIMKWVISELSRDGQVIILSFNPLNEAQELIDPKHLSLDSDNRVYVVDKEDQRVVLLDYTLKWNRCLCPTKEENERSIHWPRRLFYDEEKKQMIVGGEGVTVYTLSRK